MSHNKAWELSEEGKKVYNEQLERLRSGASLLEDQIENVWPIRDVDPWFYHLQAGDQGAKVGEALKLS